jgi:hypothetical protein
VSRPTSTTPARSHRPIAARAPGDALPLPQPNGDKTMNKDRIAGAAKQIKGAAK